MCERLFLAEYKVGASVVYCFVHQSILNPSDDRDVMSWSKRRVVLLKIKARTRFTCMEMTTNVKFSQINLFVTQHLSTRIQTFFAFLSEKIWDARKVGQWVMSPSLAALEWKRLEK